MLILALDCSQQKAVLGLYLDSKCLGSDEASIQANHSESLLPRVEHLLKQTNKKIQEIDRFGVGIGPGSFTGIRVGAATIKGLAQVQDKPVLGFSSLQALAGSYAEKELEQNDTQVVTLVHAYQGQVFAGYKNEGLWQEEAVVVKTWLESFLKSQKNFSKIILLGSGLQYFSEDIQSAIKSYKAIVELRESSENINATGLKYCLEKNKSKYSDVFSLNLHYLKPSQAEINYTQKIAKPQ